LRDDATIVCWGDNFYGQLDAPSGAFTAVSAGDDYTCGLRSGGAITCWGKNDQGQADAPVGAFVAVSAGGEHSCGVRRGGAVTCWGNNLFGQGDAPGGPAVPRGEPEYRLVTERVAAATRRTCIRTVTDGATVTRTHTCPRNYRLETTTDGGDTDHTCRLNKPA